MSKLLVMFCMLGNILLGALWITKQHWGTAFVCFCSFLYCLVVLVLMQMGIWQ